MCVCVGGGGIMYLSLHCHYQNDFCIKMASDESRFNVSLIVRDKVTNKTVSTDHKLGSERRAETDSNRGPSAYQPTALPLGQSGSLCQCTPFPFTQRCTCLARRFIACSLAHCNVSAASRSVAVTDLRLCVRSHRQGHTPSTAFRHLPPNSARFSYATEGALFVSAQLSTDAVSALRKVPVLI